MNPHNLDRLADYCRTRGLAAALLSSPWTVTWLTGYAPPIQTGPSPFEGGPTLAWWSDGQLVIIASDAEAGLARAAGAEVREYVGYTIEEPLDVVERQAAALRELLPALPVAHGPGAGWSGHGARAVGVEMRFLPAAFLEMVQGSLPGARLQPIDGEVARLRAIKTPEELGKVRAVLALCDLSQAVVREKLQVGISEIMLWGQMKARLEVEAGGRLPLLADLVGGTRTGDIGGLPGPYVLQEGDPVIADIVPRLDGYWGDICGTHFVGAPSAQMQTIYGIVRDTLQRGIDAVRPGVLSRDLDTLLRGAIRDAGYEPYPHHSGHGLGVSYHEEPRLVPYNDLPLVAGMVVAIEPGIYLPGIGGVRLENVVLVTADGCEVLTRHLQIG